LHKTAWDVEEMIDFKRIMTTGEAFARAGCAVWHKTVLNMGELTKSGDRLLETLK
jgi:hypothetical protein